MIYVQLYINLCSFLDICFYECFHSLIRFISQGTDDNNQGNPPTHTINFPYLIQRQWAHLLQSLAMNWFEPRIQPITPSPHNTERMRYVLCHSCGLLSIILALIFAGVYYKKMPVLSIKLNFGPLTPHPPLYILFKKEYIFIFPVGGFNFPRLHPSGHFLCGALLNFTQPNLN